MYLMLDEFTSKTNRRKRRASMSFRIMSVLISYSKEWTERMNSFSRVTQRKSWQSLNDQAISVWCLCSWLQRYLVTTTNFSQSTYCQVCTFFCFHRVYTQKYLFIVQSPKSWLLFRVIISYSSNQCTHAYFAVENVQEASFGLWEIRAQFI